ncbi:HAMP domain-containing sensor histidine kinase [Micromonospora sp. NPDC048999]|uniref:sensor histidine kinase n=1 Tax=Micromonospora sp. NPDC048999 TaxID=3155391 RepID=UPI0033E79F9D
MARVWIAFAAVNVVLMWYLPGQETVPFHLVWISLALVYGFTTWRLSWMVAALVAVTTTTGLILAHHAAVGEIRWEETSEEPLMTVVFGVMAWHVHRRHLLLHEMRRIGEAERDRAHRQELLVRLASHELRTPLTIARGYTELLRTAHDDPSTLADTAVVLEELDKVSRIAHRLVTLMQLEQQHPVRPVDLDTELARIARRWAPTADREWSCRSAIGLTRVNPERLEAALDCLIENAVKFTGPGDRIALVGHRDAAGWTVEVIDSGVGIPPEAVPDLLAGQPGRPTATGTGLGWAIVRAVAATLHGRITVGSGPSGGARIGLRVPEPTPAGPARPVPADGPVSFASG